MAAPLAVVAVLVGELYFPLGLTSAAVVVEEMRRPEADESRSIAAGGGLFDSIGIVGVLHGCIPRGLWGRGIERRN